MAAIMVHEFMSLDGVIDEPTRMPPPAGAALAHFSGFLRHAYQLITLSQAIALAHAFVKAGITPRNTHLEECSSTTTSTATQTSTAAQHVAEAASANLRSTA